MYRLFALFLFATVAHAAPADDLVMRGRESLKVMDVVAAMSAFDAALAADPQHAVAAYERGRILLKIGEPQKAIADFTIAILRDAGFGRALAKRGELAGAVADMESAIAVADAPTAEALRKMLDRMK